MRYVVAIHSTSQAGSLRYSEFFSFELSDSRTQIFRHAHLLKRLGINAHIKRRRRTDQSIFILRVDFEFKGEARVPDFGYASVNFQYLIKLRWRFEHHLGARQNRVDAAVGHFLPGQPDLAKVFGPSHVVEGEIVCVEDDALQIGIGEADSYVVMESEV